ncbi:hypothetical protein [Actinoallomurus rhizosphaericola]|uniref:hypothetical protein n=1 Tax=Actinoallomurus rhizosphaericola TaxID=2952536 RepID=UPI0020901101|nr:hypothetical protein [Actinoallomurus rhizosphaericola]MCO5993687.1 hypothetical protein [Actinoallomurus rhizosphaericola]
MTRRPTPPPDAVFAEMLRAARELLAVRSPLDAELIVSEMLGAWWGKRLVHDDVEKVIGEALVDHAATARTPAALALLTGIAALGTPRQAAKAERAALRLMDAGVARPGWADRVGRVACEECHVSRDVYGDQDSIVCIYTYGGEERHALVVVIDHNERGMVVDAWVSSQVDKLLGYCRKEAEESPLMRFEPIAPAAARARLERALAVTDDTEDPPVKETFGNYHAFVRARVRALPPGGHVPVTPVYGHDRRATMAAQFLASDEAEELSDRSAASRCVDRIIDYGCDHDFGRPLRVSPVKCETFLLHWLPRKVMLSPAEQEAMPHVLAAWVRWASRRTGLPEEGVRQTLDKVWDITGKFAEAYRDPTTFGLDRELVERLLPDGDLEALARRAFAFPFLTGGNADIDLTRLNPSVDADRRLLLAFEHPDADPAHIEAHLRLAARIWDGDPPQLWTVAERLLDRGHDRHSILHRFMAILRETGGDPRALRAALLALRDAPDLS